MAANFPLTARTNEDKRDKNNTAAPSILPQADVWGQ